VLSILFLFAVAVGSAVGLSAPGVGAHLGAGVDPLVLVLVALLLFTVRLPGCRVPASRVLRTATVAVAVNFLVVPFLAAALAVLLVPDGDVRLGFFIYCLFPCTDWFLGFTRVALGDTVTGAVLIPAQLALQLLLYPVWVGWFSSLTSDVPATAGAAATGSPADWSLLVSGFLVPAVVGLGLQVACRAVLPPQWGAALARTADRLVPVVISALIICLFAAHVGEVVDSPGAFGRVLVAAVAFFVVVYLLGEIVSRGSRLDRAGTTLLVMTTSARNAPLMLVLTAAFLPDRPVVLTAVILGMLIEFPHLTAIAHLRRRAAPRSEYVLAGGEV
jgi:ACR3 family arsenite transporter